MIITEVIHWFGDGAHWEGQDGVPTRFAQHLVISGEAMLIASAIALPVAIILGHLGRGGFLAVNVSNIGRAVPSFAILVLAAQVPSIGVGDTAAEVALIALALPPIVTNAYVGMTSVDPEVKEAALAMGMSGRQVLRRVELPLALPLILAGLRTSAVQVIATATLAAEVAAGGLGRYIVDGIAESDYAQVWAGALLVGGLALAVDGLFAVGQRRAARASGRRPLRPGQVIEEPAELVTEAAGQGTSGAAGQGTSGAAGQGTSGAAGHERAERTG
ncbi:MAG TPA: ABC transporter permease [Acidimicrobiales bacterium]|nr:ABC transporter permease [Acidimicrobiales bacterium]